MEELVVFGKCLNLLLTARNWSAARLAKELNLDASYVRKWIRGDRVPSIGSDYVERIANSLCRGIDTTGLRKLKEDYVFVLEELGCKPDRSMVIEEILINALSGAQMNSLKLKSEERVYKSADNDSISSLLEKLGKINKESGSSNIQTNDLYNLGSVQSLIKGRQSVLHAYIAMLEAALKITGAKKGEIVATFQSDRYPFEGYPLLETQWLNDITGVLSNGWIIKHLVRLNKDTNRSIRLIKRIIRQVKFCKQYQAFYFEKYGTIYPANELLVIEGIGALISFSMDDPEYLDAAFFINDVETVQGLLKHSSHLLKLTRPLLEIYTSLKDYNSYNTETYIKHGDRFVVREDFDSLTIPYPLWEKFFKRSVNNGDEIAFNLQMVNKRLDAFHQQVPRYKFMNIISTRAVEYLIRNQQYIYDNIFRIPSPDDIIEHLEYIIYLLKTYKNYEIGLISESQSDLLSPPYWTVKGDYSVDIDIVYPKEYRDKSNEHGSLLIINEGTVAGSFKDYFYDLWEKILPKYREKEFVIRWFEERLKWFKAENTCIKK